VKNKVIVGVVLSLIVRGVANSQSAPGDQEASHKTQARGFWTDPTTGLMWAAKDNGKDVSWKNAMKYCRDLRLAGDSDWRLASLEELKGIYDNSPGLMGPSGKGTASTWHVKSGLFLTGNQWSSTQKNDDRGHPSGWARKERLAAPKTLRHPDHLRHTKFVGLRDDKDPRNVVREM
jgi:hypothetical protein